MPGGGGLLEITYLCHHRSKLRSGGVASNIWSGGGLLEITYLCHHRSKLRSGGVASNIWSGGGLLKNYLITSSS